MGGGDQQIEPETEIGGGFSGQGGAQLIPAERTLSKGGQQAPAVVALEEHLAAHGESRPAGKQVFAADLSGGRGEANASGCGRRTMKKGPLPERA